MSTIGVSGLITTCLAIWGAILSTFQEVRRIIDKRIAGKRRTLHNFVLEAMGAQPGALAPDIDGVRFDLASIDRKVQIAQSHQLLGTDPANDEIDGQILLVPIPDGTKERKILKRQSRIGLPGIQDPGRDQKLEKILDEMVEAGRLRRHAPRTWSVN